MWDWHWWSSFLSTTLQKPPNQTSLLSPHHQDDAVCPHRFSLSSAARMLASWLNRRRRRYLILILFSPFLIPLFCATCPFICAIELCFLIRRRRRTAACGGDGRLRSDGEEGGLLQRYLEDQLMLVVGSVYECGDDDETVGEENEVDVQCFDSTRPLLQ